MQCTSQCVSSRNFQVTVGSAESETTVEQKWEKQTGLQEAGRGDIPSSVKWLIGRRRRSSGGIRRRLVLLVHSISVPVRDLLLLSSLACCCCPHSHYVLCGVRLAQCRRPRSWGDEKVTGRRVRVQEPAVKDHVAAAQRRRQSAQRQHTRDCWFRYMHLTSRNCPAPRLRGRRNRANL